MGRKWNNIKEKKASQDKQRSQVYTKILREITLAAKAGGDDVDSNIRLRLVLTKARAANVPRDNIERAIKKGTGEGAAQMEEITYEGYGPEGVAIFVETATDNVTRTVANVRSYFNKCGGALGKDGCLQFVFERKALFSIPAGQVKNEDDFTLEMIDVGADNVEKEDGYFEITAPMECFGDIQKKLESLKIESEEAGLERLPLNFKEIDKETFQKVMKLVDMLEEDDDVQKVYHNIQYDEAFLS